MKNWIWLYFRKNYGSLSSVASGCFRSSTRLNRFDKELYRNTTQSLCVNRLSYQTTHTYQSHTTPKHVQIADLLSDLNSLVTAATLTRFSNEVEITSNSGILELLNQCSDSLSKFTIDELLHFIDLLLIIQSKDRRTFKKNETIKRIIDRLDQECLVRSTEMNLENVLRMMKKFSSLTKKYKPFLHAAFRHYYKRIHNKPADILITFVEIMNKNRYWRNNYIKCKPYEMEHYLEQNFNKLDIDQITALICALIQMNKSIVNFELKKKLFLYFVQNLHTNTMSDRHLNHFLNLFCKKESFVVNLHSLTPEFLQLLDIFDEEFDTLALDNVALVGILSTKFLVHKPRFLDKLCRRFLAGERCNKSTIDNVVYTLMFFNYSSQGEDVYSKMLQIITADSLNASYKHTRRYFRLISWFCNVGVYDYNIINEILDEEYLRKTYSKLTRFCLYPYPLMIDLSVEIECPDYTGKRLSTKLKEDLLRCYNWDHAKTMRNKDKSLDTCGTDQYQLTNDKEQYDYKPIQDLPYCDILIEMSSKLNTLFGKKIAHIGYMLPHTPRPNLFFCMDENGQIQDLAYLEDNSIVDHKALDSRYHWFAVTVLIRNTFLPDTVDVVPLGSEIVKWRQLRKLNINVIAVIQDEWKSMSEEQKIKLCSNVIRLEH